MMRLLHLGAIAALLVVLLALAGCSGGGSGNDGNEPPPTGDSGTVSGRVSHADDVNIGIGGAVVNVLRGNGETVATTIANSSGNFIVRNVPAGVWTISVETPNESAYGSQQVPDVRVVGDADTVINIPVLRAIDPAPTAIQLSPPGATVDVGGQVEFNARVMGPNGDIPATPVFMVSSNVGQISADGVFTGLRVGSATITAISGNATATAAVEVVAARPPEITAFLVAPMSFGASGGRVFVTASANDGDGISSVEAEIVKPDGTTDLQSLTFNPASTDTYQLFTQTVGGPVLGYRIPANSNEPDQTGHQAPQTYSIRLVVKDGSGATTLSDFVEVTVAGLDAPPPGP